MDIVPKLILQFVLIAVNAFFAAAEIAIISLNTNKLQREAEDGDKVAAKLLRLQSEPTDFLSTIQIGITFAGFLGSAFAADNFAEMLSDWVYHDLGWRFFDYGVFNIVAIVLITILLSYFTLVLGELLPKRIAMQKPREVARVTSGVVLGISVVMKPFIRFLSFSTNAVLRLFRFKLEAEKEEVTEEEIRMMVDIGEEKGAIDAAEKTMIENVFEFNNTDASDVMTPFVDVVAIPVDASDSEVREVIKETGRSRYPVYGEDKNDILGFLYARDFLLSRSHDETTAIKEMLRPAYFVPESIRTDKLFREMQTTKRHVAMVIDEYGAVAGIITLEDLLEEIVGNIYDEYDEAEEPAVVPLGDGVFRVSGSAEIEELCEAIDLVLPEEELDFHTLGGLVYSRLGVVPDDNTELDLEAYGLLIHVDKILDRRIESAIVRKVAVSEKNEE